jgi:hypothetical protein
MTNTFTIAIGANMLLATVADGGNIEAAARADGYTGDYETITGLTLSDELPEGADAVWMSGNEGWLFLPNGETIRYAFRT